MQPSRRLAALAATVFLVAACSGASAIPAPTEAPSAAPSAAMPTMPPDPCAPANLATVAAGTLTIGTDNPAYPPYFETSDPATAPWELGDPTNGKGFESAVAYALAERLGFGADAVTWTVVPFDNSYAPGPKTFDVYLAQVSYKPDRAETADLSDGYYYVAQSVVALAGSPAASAASIADLKGLTFGAMIGTTSYDTIVNVIAPTTTPSVYNSNDDAIAALNAKQIDAIVVDLPTAFYVTAVQLENGVIVGQFPTTPGPDAERFSLVLAKGSPLTACVNAAIASLSGDGTLAAITQEWLADKVNAKVLQP